MCTIKKPIRISIEDITNPNEKKRSVLSALNDALESDNGAGGVEILYSSDKTKDEINAILVYLRNHKFIVVDTIKSSCGNGIYFVKCLTEKGKRYLQDTTLTFDD
jgi:hypothetical protein